MFCKYCGAQISDESVACDHCGSTLVQPVEQPQVAAADTNAPKKMSKIAILLWVLGGVVAIGILIVVMITTRILCLSHEYEEATCVDPERCVYCGKVNSKALGHNWSPATCTTPQTCRDCGEIGKGATGHGQTEWVVTTKATLMAPGLEEEICAECGDSLSVGVLEQKAVEIYYDAFNFEDQEFIEWLNDKMALHVDNTDLQLDGYGDNTSAYLVTMVDGGKVTMIVFHNAEGFVNKLYFLGEDTEDGPITAVAVGATLSSAFDTWNGIVSNHYGRTYTAGGMTFYRMTVNGNLVGLLAPSGNA